MASSLCMSPVGKRLGRQKQILRVGGCDSFGNIIHEIMHSLGKSNVHHTLTNLINTIDLPRENQIIYTNDLAYYKAFITR